MTDWTLEGLAAAIRAGKISPVEATRECLARIERLDGGLRAFITVDHAGALETARRARGRAGAGRLAGAAPRRAARLQGPLLHPRAADLLRDPDGRVLPGRAGLHGGVAARGRGRGHAGQAQHDRARDGALRRQRPPRPRPESVAGRALHRRLLERLRGRGGGAPRPGRRRERYRRVHPPARGGLRHRRAQADLRPGEPGGRHAAQLVERSRGADGAHRPGLRAAAAGDGGPGCARRDLEPGAGARLRSRAGPERRGSPGRRGGELLLPGHRRRDGGRGAPGGGRDRAARGPRLRDPGAGSADDERRHEHRQPLRGLDDPRAAVPRAPGRDPAGRALAARAGDADIRPTTTCRRSASAPVSPARSSRRCSPRWTSWWRR